MKSIKSIVSAFIGIIMLVGCEQKNPEFPDFDYTAVYFPHQYPVRTLSLGEEEYDNSLDQELKFHIAANIGGMYENKQDWVVEFEVLNSLAEGIQHGNGDTILALPSEWYSLTQQNQVTIPSGSFKGIIEVQLDEQFLDDPLAYGNHYVIPLVITGSTADSVLSGLLKVGIDPDTSDRRVADQWTISPKDYVLFCVKYINPYHGTYFHRGVDIWYDSLDNPVDTAIYSEIYVVDDELWNLTTNGRNVVHTNGIGQHAGQMKLIISENGQIQIDSLESSTYKALGTGTYVKEAERWGQKQRDAMYLSYEFHDGINLHRATDTLIYRNRGVKYEVFNPVIPGTK